MDHFSLSLRVHYDEKFDIKCFFFFAIRFFAPSDTVQRQNAKRTSSRNMKMLSLKYLASISEVPVYDMKPPAYAPLEVCHGTAMQDGTYQRINTSADAFGLEM